MRTLTIEKIGKNRIAKIIEESFVAFEDEEAKNYHKSLIRGFLKMSRKKAFETITSRIGFGFVY